MLSHHSCVPALVCMFFVAASFSPAFAGGSHDRTQFGHDIMVGPNEEASEVTCFGCSVHVRGHVASDVTTFGGNITVEEDGVIGGDTTSFGGGVRLEKGSKVNAVTLFGGRLHRDSDAIVQGDVTAFTGMGWLLAIFVLPLILLGAVIALIVWLVRRTSRPRIPAAA